MPHISKIELWVGKINQTYSSIFCAMVYLDNSKEAAARVDVDFNLCKVDFVSTMHSRLSGLDALMNKPMALSTFLSHDKTVLM